MATCALDMKKRARLEKNIVVGTVMSNVGLEIYLKKKGIQLVRTQVGDRYVVEEMLRRGCNFGGEQSGHIIFLDHNTTGDGAITALKMLSIMCKSGKSLSKLSSVIPVYPQVLVNVSVTKPRSIEKFPSVMKVIKKAEKTLNSGRILVRPSGTEPKIRIMVEGDSMDKINAIAEEIASIIKATMV